MTEKTTAKKLGATTNQESAEFETITLRAEIRGEKGRALDPQQHDAEIAREMAAELCDALSNAYGQRQEVRPETLAIAVQTVLETLLSGIEREGVHAGCMRVALANSMLVNGRAEVKIDVDGERAPGFVHASSKTVH